MRRLYDCVKFLVSIGCFGLVIGAVWSCGSNKIMVIDNATEVLEHPYPLNYPSTKPMPNKIISVLKKGEKAKVINHNYGKDYLVYEICLEDGRRGYVVYTKDTFRVVPANDKQ